MLSDAPAMLLGGVSDLWQREILGIGPNGHDKGKGGKFLLLPPHHTDSVPKGYIAVTSRTYAVILGVRGFQTPGSGTKKTVALMKGMRIYPLSQSAHPPATVFINSIAIASGSGHSSVALRAGIRGLRQHRSPCRIRLHRDWHVAGHG